MKNANTLIETETLTPQELATKLHTTPKRLRAILRTEFPRETKGKKWEIIPELAKKITKAYKAKAKEQKHEGKQESKRS